ncbi:MAG: flagellar hook-associated protein FlgK, partial [Clostridiales bacterium]
MGLFGSFDIAKSGMYVNERGLFVTGHNITNTNTEGYSRQQIQPTTSFYQNIDNIGQVGTGADVQGIRQVRNKFLDNIYRNEVETLGNYEVKSKTYVDVQAIIDEPFGDGLQNVLNKFWDSWQELAKDPDALAVRALVRQRGEALARQVNHIGTQLNNLQDDINQEIYVKIKEVNEYTQEIASLNGQILEMEIGNDDSNDLRDKRNLIMDKLSKVAGAKYDETSSGHINVEIGEQIVVNRNEYLKIEVKEDIIPGEAYKPKLENSSIDINFTNGQLKGLLDSAGLIGSYDNGSPNTKVDINLVIDNSDTSSDYIEKMKSSVKNYVKDLKKTGLDYNLRLITFSDTSTINSTIWDKDNIDGNLDNFEDNIDTILSGIETENSFSDVISKIESIEDFREDTTKYTVLFTNESIQGNEIDVLEEDVN